MQDQERFTNINFLEHKHTLVKALWVWHKPNIATIERGSVLSPNYTQENKHTP
jgi:hypothetical protein